MKLTRDLICKRESSNPEDRCIPIPLIASITALYVAISQRSIINIFFVKNNRNNRISEDTEVRILDTIIACKISKLTCPLELPL